jgi:hypothetical protein
MATAALALGTVLALGACDDFEAECGGAPTEPIIGFAVTTVTGDDSTNANITFCYQRRSDGSEECELLDDPFADDFEQHEVNHFQVDVASPIAAGDLERFRLKNTGGGFLGNNSWDLVGLTVEAVLQSGPTVLLLRAEEMSVNLDEGDDLDSSQCTY